MDRIYLDFNASTPVDPRVAAVMRPLLETAHGNPSSPHWAGGPARDAVERARAKVSGLLGAEPDEIVFTSGGSEANNLALKGVFFAHRHRGDHIVTSAAEHPATLEVCAFLERMGGQVTYIPVDRQGRVDPDDLARAITARTLLVTLMHANNETGTLQPIEACARIARDRGVLFHTDAAQSVGKVATEVNRLGVDLLSIAGHKLYAPKGVGALYVRRGTTLEPLIHGAGHEAGRRAGTESALLTAALGEACALASDLAPMRGVQDLRDALWADLQKHFGNRVMLNGHPEHRLPNTLNVGFVGLVGTDILARLPEVAASTGSACHAGLVELSPTLRAMGVPPEVGMGAIRFSLGRGTTSAEIAAVVGRLVEVLG
ncbi:cysteine desulfurase family protein [Phenylobacterium sp.]|uniref:cysteine desulfurase family protein n=1 Tax=Phenylobacterium sp. TaxID=1871053 RepID=UPI0030F49361